MRMDSGLKMSIESICYWLEANWYYKTLWYCLKRWGIGKTYDVLETLWRVFRLAKIMRGSNGDNYLVLILVTLSKLSDSPGEWTAKHSGSIRALYQVVSCSNLTETNPHKKKKTSWLPEARWELADKRLGFKSRGQWAVKRTDTRNTLFISSR